MKVVRTASHPLPIATFLPVRIRVSKREGSAGENTAGVEDQAPVRSLLVLRRRRNGRERDHGRKGESDANRFP
jgi:hypothetical protein